MANKIKIARKMKKTDKWIITRPIPGPAFNKKSHG